MDRWIPTHQELDEDFAVMLAANAEYDPDIQGADLRRYNDPRHPKNGGPIAYRVAFEWGEGPMKVLTPTPRMLYMLMRGGVIKNVRVVGDDPDTGRPIYEGKSERLPPMTEREAVEFLAWRDIPAGCNNVVIITTAELPSDRKMREAWRLAA
jgi:hypothetical protein